MIFLDCQPEITKNDLILTSHLHFAAVCLQFYNVTPNLLLGSRLLFYTSFGMFQTAYLSITKNDLILNPTPENRL